MATTTTIELKKTRTDETWKTINLKANFADPVVVASMYSYNGSDESVVVVKDLAVDSFKIRVVEAPDKDDNHGNEDIGYLVMDQGLNYVFGRKFWAGIEEGVTDEKYSSGSWQSVTFGDAFNAAPIVIAQVVEGSMTNNEFCKVRLRSISTTGFQYILENAQSDTSARNVDVHWVAVNPTATIDNIKFRRTPEAVGGQTEGWYTYTHGFGSGEQFYEKIIIAQIQTNNGSDACGVRVDNITSTEVDVICEEDEYGDAEQSHTGLESVGFICCLGEVCVYDEKEEELEGYAIKVVDAGLDVGDTTLEPREFSFLSAREVTKERLSGVDNSDVAHGVTGGMPMALTFAVGVTTINAAGGANLDATDLLLSASKFYRIFDNKVEI